MPCHPGGLEKTYYEMDEEDIYEIAVRVYEDAESATPAEIAVLAQFVIDQSA